MPTTKPSEGAEARARGPGRRRRPVRSHLLDYVRIVRSRWLLALVVFLAVFALKVYDALLAEPIYEARAILQVERRLPGQESMFSPFASLNLTLVTSAELEVLRSFPVAKIAAKDPRSGAIVSIEELNEYRPLETALRSFQGGWKACNLKAYAKSLDRGSVTLFLEFDETGRRIRAHMGEGRVLDEFGPDDWAFAEPYDDDNGNNQWDPGEPFTDQDGDGLYDAGKPICFGGDEENAVVLVDARCSPAGRTYVLTRRSLPKAAHWLQAGATAREVSEFTGILSVGFRADSPWLSAAAANALANGYRTYKQQKQKEEIDRRVAWLEKEVLHIKEDLEALEVERDRYVAREGGTVLLGERAGALHAEQREITSEKMDQEARFRSVEWRLEELAEERPLDEMLLILSLDVVDAKTSALATEITQFETSRDVLLALERVTTETPKVKELNAQIREIEKRLDVRVRALVARQKELLTLESKAFRRRIDQIDVRYAELQTEIETLPAKEREFIRRSRPIEIHEELFHYLTKAQMESEMTRESIVSRVHILDPAVPPSVRQSPKVSSTGIVAIILGVLAAVVAIFLREYMIRTITSPQDLEEGLGLTVYAAIPDYRTVKRRERRGLKHGRSMVALRVPNSVLTESYRTLRANIKFTNPAGAPRTLAITSALEQEGKSITTLNLAIVMAQAGDKVLVVDADMRRPSTHVHLSGQQEPGLVEVLRGEARWQDVVSPQDVEGLHVLHAGQLPKNPSALLDSPAFQAFAKEVREAYDYVLFDVPPVLAVADASAFFRQLDGILLLTRYRRCTLETIDGAMDQIERLGGNVLGIVFNAFDARASARRGYGYYGYYGYYSRYGGYRSDDSGKQKAS